MKLKRVILNLVCFLVVAASVAATSATEAGNINTINSSGLTEEQMLLELQPYQMRIDRINSEYGSSIQIPDDGVEKVYKSVIGTDLAQFEQDLRRHYQDALTAVSRVGTLVEVPSDTRPSGPMIEDRYIIEISED